MILGKLIDSGSESRVYAHPTDYSKVILHHSGNLKLSILQELGIVHQVQSCGTHLLIVCTRLYPLNKLQQNRVWAIHDELQMCEWADLPSKFLEFEELIPLYKFINKTNVRLDLACCNWMYDKTQGRILPVDIITEV